MLERAALLLFACAAWTCAAFADPPAHAPAHGWRKKHDPYYVGYTGAKWEHDYGVASGRCDHETVGAVLGGIAGGAIGSRAGSQSGSSEQRAVATIIGAVAGAYLGARIGRELDAADRSCFGHALEVATLGSRVAWVNPRTNVSYVLVPGGERKVGGRACRHFELSASRKEAHEKRRGTACPTGNGVWNILQ